MKKIIIGVITVVLTFPMFYTGARYLGTEKDEHEDILVRLRRAFQVDATFHNVRYHDGRLMFNVKDLRCAVSYDYEVIVAVCTNEQRVNPNNIGYPDPKAEIKG